MQMFWILWMEDWETVQSLVYLYNAQFENFEFP